MRTHAARRARSRRGAMRVLTVATTGLLLAGCGSTVTGSGAGDTSSDPPEGAATSAPPATGDPTVTGPVVSDPDAVLTGQGLILQEDGKAPVLCFGGVLDSYPPQCDGPELVGLDWSEVPGVETAVGVTWAEARVVGAFERSTATDPRVVGPFEGSTFTLTAPPSEISTPVEPVDGTGDDQFPVLCDDPFRRGDPDFVGDSDAGFAAMIPLGDLLEKYPGYVGHWVSDGRSMFNVLVTGDAEQAHADFREVWPGGLCVEQRDAATQSKVRRAQQAVHEAGVIGVQSSGGSGEGTLGVTVLLADADTVEAIHQAVEPWLTPEQVKIHSSLVPVEPQG